MSLNTNVVFVGDLHLGHQSILKHTDMRSGTTIEEHDDWVMERLLSVGPTKRTLWYILGDVAMDIRLLDRITELPGRKILVAGNHDLFDTQAYLKVFERVMGGFKKYNFWITHMPMHPKELYGLPNIHGHTHYNTVADDPYYFNAAIEWLPEKRPITLDEINAHWTKNIELKEMIHND